MKYITPYIFRILLLLYCVPLSVFCQDDTSRITDSLSEVYQTQMYKQPLVAQKAAQHWLAYSQEKKIPMQEARAHYALGNLGTITGNYQATVTHTQKAIKLLKQLDYEQGLPACYNMLALGYKNLGDYPHAMDNFLLCLTVAKKTENTQQQANAYQNIATLYILQKEYKKAAENLDRAANMFRLLGDDDGVLITLFNYANILKEQGRFNEARKQYQTVLKYREREGNKAVVAYVHINLSQMLVDEEKYNEALPALENTLHLLKQLHFNSDIAIVLNDLGLCESKLGNTQKAINYFQEALAIGEEQSLINYNANFYKNLSQLYATEGNYKKALEFYEKGVNTEAIQHSLDKEKYVANLQERYETELKETRIKLLEQEQKLNETELQKAELAVKRQLVVRNAFIAGFVLVLISLIILRHFYVQRLRTQKELVLQQEENARQKIQEMIKDHKLSAIERYQEGQDEERARLAREIHDGIGSDLAGIKIAFEYYIEQQPKNTQVKRLLEAIRNACQDVRGLSHQLHPLAFSNIGFSSFLNDFINQISEKSSIQIKTFFFPQEAIDKLPDSLLADAYRIVQELVTNILKHSEATTAEIQLTKHEDHLNIVVNDNGKGFQKTKKQGIGLRNIKERLEKLNGSVDIDSNATNGTSIMINIPLN